MSSTHPYYRKRPPGPFHVIRSVSDGVSVDLKYVRLPWGGVANTVAEAARRFDARTAEFVRASAGNVFALLASGQPIKDTDLLELKDHPPAPQTHEPTNRLLAVLAYGEYFPYVDRAGRLNAMASNAILAADPGWCGSIGPAIHDTPTFALTHSEGNYDLAQMRLLPMAYRYYDELTPPAQEHLIQVLLATGTIHRVDEDDIFTSGGAPNDWSRAGYVSPFSIVGPFTIHIRIAETENHILQIHTARYLTNQLLYQRDHDPNHDNRRNGSDDSPTCMNLMLRLLRNFLRDDFSEYNAKPYQHETRTALLNLCSYAYDHEVRLAARMVLDYVSAHIAVSSCDLRRLVPFRRRNEGDYSKLLGESGFMDVGLLEWQTGSDHSIEHFVVQAGNTRAYETVTPIELAPVMPGKNEEETRKIEKDNVRSEPWTILGGGGDGMSEGLSDYRLPPSIHDLFVNDLHRRFFQTLNRTPQGDVESGQNSTDSEIYAGSPSYLISAGGQPTTYAIDPGIAALLEPSTVAQELGVAVTTSFMPTSGRTGDMRGAFRAGTQNYSQDLIQFGSFAQEGSVENYGVAPDFACGHVVHLPPWVQWSAQRELFFFVDMHSTEPGTPGFYLAFLRDGDFTVMEAHDTWLDPTGLTFPDFCAGVHNKNHALRLNNFQKAFYFMTNRNRVQFSIWNDGSTSFGARVYSVETPAEVAVEAKADADPTTDSSNQPRRRGDARAVGDPPRPFLSGTIMQSARPTAGAWPAPPPPPDAVVRITNPALGTEIVLDMHDPAHPKRLSETGEFEEAGSQNEVWVDFDSDRPEEGDFFHPFRTVAAAAAAVADNGVIKIVPGSTRERPRLSLHKRVRIEAAIGGVTIGRR